MHRTSLFSVGLAIVLVAVAFSSAATAAPPYKVTNGDDDGPGSLRAGLATASHILIHPSVSTITIDSTLVYDGTEPLTIQGKGQTVDGGGLGNTLLEIAEGADLRISNLDFTDGGGYGLPPANGGGKGIFVNVPSDRTGVVRLNLKNVAVTGVGLHGIHVSDCDIVGCGAGGGGGGGGSEASVHARLVRVSVDDAGNGAFDADGLRIDERDGGDIVFRAVRSSFTNVGADGVELDAGDDGNVAIRVINSRFDSNGGYCFGVDVNAPADPTCVEDDDGELVLDLDDGFDVDEAGEGSIVGQVVNSRLVNNLDEGLDFDEEGDGGFRLKIVKTRTIGNGDEGIKLSEEDGGNVTARLRAVRSFDNGDDGAQIEEEGDGDLTVTVNATRTGGNSKSGLKVTEDDAGDGTLRVRGSDISEGIDTNVTEL